MPPPNDDAPPIPNPPVGKQPIKRGPGFTAIEDILVAKSFIAASENPICGAHQKGKQFKESMLTLYNRFAKEQIEKDQAILDKCSSISREEYIKNGMGKHIPLDRSFDSIYYRFKSILAPDVMKFMGIMETTDMASGWNEDDHKTACLELYKKRQGKTFDHYGVYEYLNNKQKFSTFRTKIEEEASGKRPVGKKKSRQTEMDSKLVKSVISEVLVNKGGEDNVVSSMDSERGASNGNKATEAIGVIGGAFKGLTGVLENAAGAIMENMQKENEIRLMQYLDTPVRKEFAKRHLELMMAEKEERSSLVLAESRAKRRRLEYETRKGMEEVEEEEEKEEKEDD
jgi:hypothetical protein